MNNSIVVLGTQWGDEGKGKIVDQCAHEAGTLQHTRNQFQRTNL